MPTIKSYKTVLGGRARVAFHGNVTIFWLDITRENTIWVNLFNFFKYFLFLFEDFERLA